VLEMSVFLFQREGKERIHFLRFPGFTGSSW